MALLAGVPLATASRALHGADGRQVGDELRLELLAATAAGIATVTIGEHLDGIDAVVVANYAGAGDLARHLHGLGYRRFAVLAGPSDTATARDRACGSREALAELGIIIEHPDIVISALTRDGGHHGEPSAAPDRTRGSRPCSGPFQRLPTSGDAGRVALRATTPALS